MTTPQVYVAGQPVPAKIGNLVIAHEWPDAGIGGPASAEFEIQLAPANRPSWLVKDALADVRLGGWFLLSGKVDEVDWSDDNSGKITIAGAAREGESTACLTTGGLTSSTPDTFIDGAIARGALTWSRPASISTTALSSGDQTSMVNSVVSVLAAYAEESGARLYVDAYRRLLKAASDPTTPMFYLQPGAGELSWTSETQATRIFGGYHTSAGAPQVASVGSGAVEQMVNLDPKGPLDLTRATNILNSLLAKATSGGWTGGLTVSSEQIVGRPHLATVADAVGEGCMFRLLGQREPRPGRIQVDYVDFVAERSEWDVNAGTLTLTPMGMVARDWNAVLADAGVEAAA